MITFDVTADLREFDRRLNDFQRKQLPFATALALTRLAKGVVGEERDEMAKTFDTPTPFTLNSITMRSATKSRPIATVFPKDIAAHYLEPYVIGGKRSLGTKRGMLTPKNVATNSYGNLPKNKLAQLKSKKGVFVGSITSKRTGKTVSGVWQRGATPRGARYKGGGEHGTRGKNTNVVDGVRTTLKLLIRFSDTTEVPRRLPFHEAARRYLKVNTQREFEKALAEALRTAKA